ncbi:DNA-processing protein DprA [Chryseobacterium indoltheticum]|uniref:DNA-processing protein DprA n=1 Tax=Chryseobacterium indoltheticum TaxID=254 RepID=UPI003F49697C
MDLKTHYTSLKNDGSTIIVLPEGLENFKIKKILKDVWDWERVLVISEYLPNAIWSVSRAMERNSTIVALSNLMVLIEAI